MSSEWVPYEVKSLPYEEIINRLLGGTAEPVGDEAFDGKKAVIQKDEERIIDYLIDDMFRCLFHEDSYCRSMKTAGKRAREYLQNLYEEIGCRLNEGRREN